MRSFLAVAVSLACIQVTSAIPMFNHGGHRLYTRQMSCGNMSGLIPLNLLGHSTCTMTGGGSAGPPPGAGDLVAVHRVVNTSRSPRSRSSRTSTIPILSKRF
ncbi:hypothetical protein PCASD_20955 [Puccinia coronata f. sp. avenae]|uniref:Secreted protein n=1 Tax=Puccinia coronata f. sp. avenae TaxID=200324 RepID=A0A2N5S3D0_9BASI|nr:hypothetical protein PCASD_20955 [Puccinia coronata f. sp. avenae]